MADFGVVSHALTMKKNYMKEVQDCRQQPEKDEQVERMSSRKEFHEDILLFELNRLDDLAPICILSFRIS